MQEYGELMQSLLGKRGIKDKDEAGIFLNPEYVRDLHDPFLMKDMERACARIFSAVSGEEKIIIYADYDCDGIPGAVILVDVLKKIGAKNYEVYIPQRNSEGYGLNMEAVKQFIESGVKLILTVDLGITAIEEVAEAGKEGIDVIILDHHLPSPFGLPKAHAILNPKIDDYPEKMLCGAGVAFKLAQGIAKKAALTPGWEKWLLDMAGLATLSDRVPLLGENRAIAYFGMKVLRKSPRPGLQKLLAKMNIDQRYLTEDDVGFMVTPRLNAASRMDNPMRAYELLSTEDEKEAGVLAEHLSKINDERKTIVSGIMREVNRSFEKRELGDVIVVGNPTWRVGVLGLVAGKISDEYKKPVFVWGKDENECIKGSCRSDGSVNLVDLMAESASSFSEFGGHELAGGFTVLKEKVHFLEDVLAESYNKLKRAKAPEAQGYDAKSGLVHVNMKNWREIERLAPFGHSNPKPVFMFDNVKVENIKKFGKNGGEHLEITFSDQTDYEAKAVSFFSSVDSFPKKLLDGIKVDLLATFDLSRFRGREELRLRIVDIN